MHRTLRTIATHTAVFFMGYWLAGGCDYKTERISKEKYTRDIGGIEKRLENYESRLEELEIQYQRR